MAHFAGRPGERLFGIAVCGGQWAFGHAGLQPADAQAPPVRSCRVPRGVLRAHPSRRDGYGAAARRAGAARCGGGTRGGFAGAGPAHGGVHPALARADRGRGDAAHGQHGGPTASVRAPDAYGPCGCAGPGAKRHGCAGVQPARPRRSDGPRDADRAAAYARAPERAGAGVAGGPLGKGTSRPVGRAAGHPRRPSGGRAPHGGKAGARAVGRRNAQSRRMRPLGRKRRGVGGPVAGLRHPPGGGGTHSGGAALQHLSDAVRQRAGRRGGLHRRAGADARALQGQRLLGHGCVFASLLLLAQAGCRAKPRALPAGPPGRGARAGPAAEPPRRAVSVDERRGWGRAVRELGHRPVRDARHRRRGLRGGPLP